MPFNLFKSVASTGGTVITSRCQRERVTMVLMRWDHVEIDFYVTDLECQHACCAEELANVMDRKALEALIKHTSKKQVASSQRLMLTMLGEDGYVSQPFQNAA